MNFIDKIKKGGIKWIIGALGVVIYIINTNIFKLFPLNKRVLVFESVGDFADNSYALYDYMLRNGYMERYKAIWLVSNRAKYRKRKLQNTIFVERNLHKLSIQRDFYLAVCQYYIFDHNNYIDLIGKRKGQKIINLWHGTAIKATTLKNKKSYSSVDCILSTGRQATINNALFLMEDEDKFIELGFPRNDFLLSKDSISLLSLCDSMNLHLFNKIFLWMPTFRKSKEKTISQDYLQNETGLPLISSYEEIEDINCFMEKNNSLLVLKVHPLQEELPIFERKFSNIVVIKNEFLDDNNVQLYEFVKKCDCLITDYSSICFDFLLLDKPILFTLDDYEGYNCTRGFINDNILDMLPGPHVDNIEKLRKEIMNVIFGVDRYGIDRQEIKSMFYKYPDGFSSKRIVEFLGL